MHRNSAYDRYHGYFTTRGLICIAVRSVLEKVALRQLSDASYGPKKPEEKLHIWKCDIKEMGIRLQS